MVHHTGVIHELVAFKILLQRELFANQFVRERDIARFASLVDLHVKQRDVRRCFCEARLSCAADITSAYKSHQSSADAQNEQISSAYETTATRIHSAITAIWQRNMTARHNRPSRREKRAKRAINRTLTFVELCHAELVVALVLLLLRAQPRCHSLLRRHARARSLFEELSQVGHCNTKRGGEHDGRAESAHARQQMASDRLTQRMRERERASGNAKTTQKKPSRFNQKRRFSILKTKFLAMTAPLRGRSKSTQRRCGTNGRAGGEIAAFTHTRTKNCVSLLFECDAGCSLGRPVFRGLLEISLIWQKAFLKFDPIFIERNGNRAPP